MRNASVAVGSRDCEASRASITFSKSRAAFLMYEGVIDLLRVCEVVATRDREHTHDRTLVYIALLLLRGLLVN